MAQQRGSTTKIVIGFEDDYGVAADDGFVLPINSCSLRPAQTLNQAQTLRGNRNPIKPFRGNKDVNGSIVVPVDSRAFWYWFKAMFGEPTTAGKAAAAWSSASPYTLGTLVIPTTANGRYYEATVAGTPGATEPTWPTTIGATVTDGAEPNVITWTCRAFTHVFKVGDEQPSMTIEEQMTDLDTEKFIQYLGCKVSSFSMDVGGDGELVATIGIMGASYAIEDSAFDSSPTEISIARVGNFQAALEEGGSPIAVGTQLSINIDAGLDGDTFVIGGQGVRGSLPEGIMGVGGSVTFLFDSTDMIEKGLDAVESSMKLTITHSTVSVFEIEMAELEFGLNSPEIPGPQGLRATMDFQAYLDNDAGNSAIIARLINIDQHAA